MASLAQESVQRLSVIMLIDLLTLEQDDERSRQIAEDLESVAEDLLMAGAYADAQMVTEALADCRQCHSFDDGQSSGAVSLWGVFGRRIAAGDAQLYSAALKRMSGVWDEAALDRFLRSPQTMVPGTTMQYGGIADPELRGQVIGFLKQLK